jgi:hypothetical protein
MAQFQSIPIPQTAGQQQLYGGLEQLLGSLMGRIQNAPSFEPIAQQARSQFAQQTVPTLAERFTSMGSNKVSSPAFASQLGAAGAGLEEGLAGMGSQYQLGQQQLQSQLLSSLLGTALQPQSFLFQQPEKPTFGQQFMQGLGGGLNMLGQAAGSYLLPGFGGALAQGGMSGLSSLFGNKQQMPQQNPMSMMGMQQSPMGMQGMSGQDRTNALMGLLAQIRGAR